MDGWARGNYGGERMGWAGAQEELGTVGEGGSVAGRHGGRRHHGGATGVARWQGRCATRGWRAKAGHRLGERHPVRPESEGRARIGREARRAFVGGAEVARRDADAGNPEPLAGWERAACPPARCRRGGGS